MVDAFGEDERTDEIDAAMDEDANGLTTTWKAVVGAAEWRLRSSVRSTRAAAPKPEAQDGPEPEGNGAPADEGRAARILEYFSKT